MRERLYRGRLELNRYYFIGQKRVERDDRHFYNKINKNVISIIVQPLQSLFTPLLLHKLYSFS